MEVQKNEKMDEQQAVERNLYMYSDELYQCLVKMQETVDTYIYQVEQQLYSKTEHVKFLKREIVECEERRNKITYELLNLPTIVEHGFYTDTKRMVSLSNSVKSVDVANKEKLKDLLSKEEDKISKAKELLRKVEQTIKHIKTLAKNYSEEMQSLSKKIEILSSKY